MQISAKTLKKYSPIVGLLVINVIQAGYDVATAAAFDHSTVHPTVFAFLRAAGATVLLVIAAWYKERRRPAEDRQLFIDREDIGLVIAVGVLALAGHTGLMALALSEAPPAMVGMFAPIAPAISLTISLVIGMEPFNKRAMTSWLKIAGAAVTLSGGIIIAAVAMSSDTDLDAEGRNLSLGVAYLFLGKLCSASYPIIQKIVLNKYRSPVVAAWMYIYGTIGLLTSVIPLTNEPAYWAFDKTSGLSLLYAIVLASAVNYSLISYVNKRLNPVLLTASYPTESLFAPVLAYAFLGQGISAADGIGGGVITLGLIMTVYAKWKEGAEASPAITLPKADSTGYLSVSPRADGTSMHAQTASRIFVDPSTVDDPSILAFDVPGPSSRRSLSLPIVFHPRLTYRGNASSVTKRLLHSDGNATIAEDQEDDEDLGRGSLSPGHFQTNARTSSNEQLSMTPSRLDMLSSSITKFDRTGRAISGGSSGSEAYNRRPLLSESSEGTANSTE